MTATLPIPTQLAQRACVRFAASGNAKVRTHGKPLARVLQWVRGVLQRLRIQSHQAGRESRRLHPILPSPKTSFRGNVARRPRFDMPRKGWASPQLQAASQPYAAGRGLDGNARPESHPKPKTLRPLSRADETLWRPWAGCFERLRFMQKLIKKYPHSFALLLIGLLGLAVFNLGVSLGAAPVTAATTAFTILALGQLSQFAMSKRRGGCFLSGLTPEQVKEFEEIMDGLKEFPKRLESIEKQVNAVRRLQLGAVGRTESGQNKFVSDGCAEQLGSILVISLERKGLLQDNRNRESLLQRASSILGIEQRAALTSSDIPLPVAYSAEVVYLVGQYGMARRFGTMFPLGTGTTKLPKLSTDPTFGLISASGTVTEKSPQTGWVTFTAEKFGGLIRIPSEISEDSIIPLGNFIADYAARNLARVEDEVFFNNLDGATLGAVKGLCGSTITNAKVTQMAATKTHYSDATVAYLRTLRSVPDASAVRRGAYYLHPTFEQLLASFNTAGDRPYNPMSQLQASGAQPFQFVPTFDGFPIYWVDIMPAYSTGVNVSKVFVLFGDLKFQYLGTMGQIRFDTSVEAAFATDEILIRALERFTIGLMATGAVAGLQTAAA